MQIQFMCKLAGKYSLLLLLVLCFFGNSTPALAQVKSSSNLNLNLLKPEPKSKEWELYEESYARLVARDRINGISYIISGGLALAGGLVGQNLTSDPIEKSIYALFQTIGIASVGYGAYTWFIGEEERFFIRTIKNTRELSDHQRYLVMKSYEAEKLQMQKDDRFIKAVTHGLVAALNLYTASNQSQESIKNILYFIGGANLLATLSYTF